MTAASILAVIFSGIVGIILASGMLKWMNTRALHRLDGDTAGMGDEVLERLSQIERRLTDTQDVMLALSDKLDRWDHEVPVGVRSMDDTLDKGEIDLCWSRYLGGVLLTIGVLLAAKMLFGVLAAVASVAFVGVLIWGGWRLLSRA